MITQIIVLPQVLVAVAAEVAAVAAVAAMAAVAVAAEAVIIRRLIAQQVALARQENSKKRKKRDLTHVTLSRMAREYSRAIYLLKIINDDIILTIRTLKISPWKGR